MSSAELINSVVYWNEWLAGSKKRHYDIAIFKIWIQFERTLGELFETYLLGNRSIKNYCPNRRLDFSDIGQYKALAGTGKYLDHLKHSKEKSKLIFEQHDNPFEAVYNDLVLSKIIDEVYAIRNYIAHESPEAKVRFKNVCLGGASSPDIAPNDFLQRMRKREEKINYTYYTEKLVEIIEYFEDPRPIDS